MSAKLEPLEISDGQANWLREMARAFDAITPPGERYRAPDFVEWLLLEARARSRDQVTERRRDDRQIRQMNRAAAF